MSTQLKGVTCRTGDLQMTRFWGGQDDGSCVQLTFRKPESEHNRPDFGYWYATLTREQARELAVALFQFADGTREEAE